ncbi:MAG: hypothetical protein WCJ64_00200 [Rhodospirillaceae bacterium]
MTKTLFSRLLEFSGPGFSSAPIIIFIICVKITLFFYSGPILTPDSHGYAAFSDIILGNDRTWFHHTDTNDILTFRIIGYPVFLAASKAIAGSGYTYLVVILQILISLYATFVFFRTVLALSGSSILAQVLTLAQATGLALVLDMCVLTDSFYASLFTFIVCRLVRDITERRPPTWQTAASVGCLLALAFLLREATLFLALALAPLAGLWIWRPWGTKRSGWTAICLLVLPLAGSGELYQLWNKFRTGESFITTGGSTAYLQPLVEVAKGGVPVFADEAVLDTVARKHLISFSFEEIGEIGATLHSVYGLSGLEISRLTSAKFSQCWSRFPAAMALHTLKRLSRQDYLLATVRVDESLREIALWSSWNGIGTEWWQKPIVSWRELVKGNIGALPVFIIQILMRTISGVMFIVFLIYPFVASRQPPVELPREVLILAWTLWVYVFAFTFAYGLVHVETRYLAPVTPAILMVAALALRRLPSARPENDH